MPATNQWAVSTLIREVLADPDLARRASSAACSRPGRTGLVDAESPVGIATTTLRDAPGPPGGNPRELPPHYETRPTRPARLA